jgi:hypothetical protein
MWILSKIAVAIAGLAAVGIALGASLIASFIALLDGME